MRRVAGFVVITTARGSSTGTDQCAPGAARAVHVPQRPQRATTPCAPDDEVNDETGGRR
jgi:hypothetical protein